MSMPNWEAIQFVLDFLVDSLHRTNSANNAEDPRHPIILFCVECRKTLIFARFPAKKLIHKGGPFTVPRENPRPQPQPLSTDEKVLMASNILIGDPSLYSLGFCCPAAAAAAERRSLPPPPSSATRRCRRRRAQGKAA